ncbi:MAG: leucine-rich repeat protein [Treponema sp.]|nr:leucine-rich repeat protein [Treponema sp.]
MAKRIIIAALLAFLVLGTLFAQQRETARGHITQGQEHMRAQNFAEAIASFEAALRLEPRNRQAPALLREAQERRMQITFNQGQSLHNEGKFIEAIEQYNLAIRYAPPGHNTRAAIQNRITEAQRALGEMETQAQEQTVRERTELSQQKVQKANEHLIAGQYGEAIGEYESAVNIGGLSEAETAEAKRLVSVAQEIQVKLEAYNRALRDSDFDVLQNQDASITITNYLASETMTVNIGSVNHTVHLGIFNVVIPPTLHGQRVTIIQSDSFRNKGITSITFPNSITEIGISAFADNKLERVVFGTGLRIIRGGAPVGRAEVNEKGAFEGNPALTNIVIPDTTTEIGARAFRDCGLTTLTLGRVVAVIGESAFRNNKLTNISLPASVRRIHRFAFNTNQIANLNIPQGVQQIWDDAFTENPMTAVIIPASLAPLFQNNPSIGVDHEQYGPNIPSFPNTITRVTLPANVQDRNMNGFHISLRNFYISQQRRAGLYVKSDTADIWSRQ